MKDNILVIGLIIYILATLIDRFILKFNSYLYITILCIAIICMIVGLIQSKK